MFLIRKVQDLIEKLPLPFRNVYILTVLIFSLWMVFFDKHSLITHIKLSNIIYDINRDMENYKEQIEVIEIEKALMDSKTERYVREKYFMSKENEDIFIIVRN